MSSSKSEDVQRWRAAVCEAVASMTPDPNGKFMRYQDHVERLARVTAERDLLFDEGARKGQALAEVTAERDEAREIAEKAVSTANAIVNGRHLAQLLDAVEAYDTANRESDPVVWKRLGQLVTLAAKIREERS